MDYTDYLKVRKQEKMIDNIDDAFNYIKKANNSSEEVDARLNKISRLLMEGINSKNSSKIVTAIKEINKGCTNILEKNQSQARSMKCKAIEDLKEIKRTIDNKEENK